MNKSRNLWILISLVCLFTALAVSGETLPASSAGLTPAEMLEQAWQNAQDAGSYRFISDIEQLLIPRPVPEMIGQQETALSLTSDGAVILPDQAYLEMGVADDSSSRSVAILRDGQQSFLLQDGELKPVENVLNLSSQTSDLMGYLAAADQVTLLNPPEGHPNLLRYGFIIDGPRYAEYVRQQTEAAMQAEPGAPRGLSVEPLPALETLTGQGELWVNQEGLPVRQVVELQLPEVNAQYSARVSITANFSAFGKVDALPQAVQDGGGAWRLQGSLSAEVFPFAAENAGLEPLAAAGSAAEAASETTWWSSLLPEIPLQVSPSAAILFVVILLAVVFMLYYRRNPRRCYAIIAVLVITAMVLSPVLESTGLVRYFERRVLAAEESAAGTNELLTALGFEMKQDGEEVSLQSTGSGRVRPGVLLNPSQIGLQQESGDELLERCGQGTSGVDSDADGLDDPLELCLGTNLYDADSDQDGIPDKAEIDGFDLGGTHWDSNPMEPDSNGDGTMDTLEWAATAAAPNGQAVGFDIDGDSLPNLWDEDDDGDAVPDVHDLSPFALSGYTTSADLNLSGSGVNEYTSIEIQMQPEEPIHLRYTTTALDWPEDHKGNVKDLDDSTQDLRLIPYLIVTANAAPAENLGQKYGFRSWRDASGQYVIMAPLAPVQESGAVHSFYAKIVYAPSQFVDLDWKAEMVWMAEMQNDYSDQWAIKSESKTLHEYQDSFRITGLKITKDRGYEAAVLGTPDKIDDLELFQVLLGLSDTFKTHISMENQTEGQTALEQVASRFGSGTASYLTFGVEPELVSIAGPEKYGHMDEAVANMGGVLVPGFLEDNSIFYEIADGRCQDAEGSAVNCASLLLAYESSMGVQDLSEFTANPTGEVDLNMLHVNLVNVPLMTTRGVQLRFYEKDSSGWQTTSAARMLELVEQRYKDDYSTAMRDLYPDLREDDVRYIAYTAYLLATSPSFTPISVDGQALVDEYANEAQLALDRSMDLEMEGQVRNAVDYVGMSTGIAAALTVGGASYVGWALNDAIGLRNDWKSLTSGFKAWNTVGVGLSVASMSASLIMSIINAVCSAGADVKMCRNEDALKVANAVVQSLAIIGQVQATIDMIIKAVKGTLDAISKLAMGIMVVGLVVSIAMTWVSFALTMAFGGLSNPVVWRNALASAIVTTVYLIVMFIINCIPVIGQIIAAIMAIIDALFSLFTWLFTGEAQTIATALLSVFYSAEVCTNIGEAIFGEFDTSLLDSDLGLVGGNTMQVSVPFDGALYEEAVGNHDDLAISTMAGRLTDSYAYYSPEENAARFSGQDMSSDETCRTSDTIKYCSNTASFGYLLTPRINGIIPVKSEVDYTIVWAEMGGGGSWRYTTNTWEGVMPEETAYLKPEFMYMDILPVNVSDLWTWGELTNPDPDGDNLTYEQEVALGTSPDTWDTDGDGLSDSFEWQAFDLYATSPTDADSDFDGLNDALEIRLGTFANVADSDSDGLSDGDEVRHYSVVDDVGAMAGGWQITMPGGSKLWVSSDPLQSDADHDGLTDSEEYANGLSPYALNQPVPELILNVTPMTGLASGRAGAYWSENQPVTVKIHMMNGSPDPVNTALTLDIPSWLVVAEGGTTFGNRVLVPTITATQYSWNFSADPLLTYEAVDVTLNATTAEGASGNEDFVLALDFGGVKMRKAVSAVLDGDPPDVAILAPTDGAYLRGETFIIGGTASDPTTWVDSVELSIGGSGFQPLEGVSGAWSYLWDFPEDDGVFTLQARAADALAHTTLSEEVAVTVDNTPPTVTLNTAVDVTYDDALQQTTVQLSGSASDNLSGVEWVRLSIDEQPWRSVNLTDGAWTYDWIIGEGAQGDHEVKAVAYDRSRNQSSIQSASITIDAIAPSSVVTGGADPDVPPAFQSGETFSLTGVADEGGHLPLPAATADLRTDMDVFEDSAVWLGLSTIADNDGGVLAAWIGDFNADRMADLAVGLPGPDGDAGQVSVVYGSAGGWPNQPDLTMLSESPMRYIGKAGARLGSHLAAAGDTNGDNFSDLLIAGRNSNQAYLVFGKPMPQGEVTLDGGQNAYRVELQTPTPVTGLAAAGDVNGDGLGDVLVTAGSTAYLIFGMVDPWPVTLDVKANAAASFSGSGAFGVGDTDKDQLAEWVVTAPQTISLYNWDSEIDVVTFVTQDAAPQIAALGDINQDGQDDWLYSSAADPVLVYGTGDTDEISGYDGFIAAPGDVDGDGRPDILLTDSGGLATLIHYSGGSLDEFASLEGVGGAANAPYASGADLNSDGSDDLLLIPSQAAAEARGFDAPNFSSGFIAPQSLPLGTTSITQISSPLPRTATSDRISRLGLQSFDGPVLLSSTVAETRYVDDDGGCEGHAACYTTIQAAVDASDGGGDRIVVYPGVYDVFTVYDGPYYDHLTIQGVSADAVFVEALNKDPQKFYPAITIYADGVRLSNLTVRSADAGVYLSGDAGTAPSGGGNETSLDHILVHSVDMPIRMDYAGALSISDSTLVENGVYEIINVTSSSDIHDWDTSYNDVPANIESGGTIVSAGSEVYAMIGGDDSTIYHARPMSPGVLQPMDSSTLELHHLIPPDGSTLNNPQGTNLLVGGVNTLSQIHSTFINSNLGGEANGIIEAIAIHPTNGDVYVGGQFTTIDGTYYGHIAFWDGSAWHWLGEGGSNGTNGTVRALAFDVKGDLYVGGEFTQAGGISANHLAMWDGTSWSTIGIGTDNGLNGPVYALKYHDTSDSTGDDLYIGGSFSESTEYTSTKSPAFNITMLNIECRRAAGTRCFQPRDLGANGPVYTLDLGGGYLYFGGAFTAAGYAYNVPAKNVAAYSYVSDQCVSLGAGLNNAVQDVAVDQRDGHVYAASQGFDPDEGSSSESDIYEWTGAAWTRIPGNTGGAYAVAIDDQGNVYTGTHLAHLKIRKGGSGDFVDFLANYQDFTTDQTNWSIYMKDLVVDSAGRLYGAIYGSNNGVVGALSLWVPPSLSRHPAGDGIWSRKAFPIGINTWDTPIAAAADSSDNLYAVWSTGSASVFYYYDAAANSWTQKSYPTAAGGLKHLAWAGGRLYALGLTASGWRFTTYNPAANLWSTPATLPADISGAAASSLAMAWDGSNYLYLLRGDTTPAFLRYSLNAAVWQTLADPNPYWTNISAVNGIAMTMLKNATTGDNHFYIYATPLPPTDQSKNTYNIFSYGALPASDLRLTVDRTAFVMRDASTTQRWLGLADVGGSYVFQTDIDTSNAWVGRAGVTYTPALPVGASWITSSAAAFMAPEDGLYRLSSDSVLKAGYNQYKAVAHVYPSEAACGECSSGGLTWGEDAFATVREGVESGAASVLVHPGRYPQTFYLVSGVSVVGSGAESTIIEPPAGSAATLVTAEGVASASLARLTLTGNPLWNGFLAEGGTRGLSLTRTIVRGLNTGVRLRGDSEVEIVNNTIVGNVDGITFEDTSPVDLRNTILAYNSGTGLTISSSASSVSNIYNSFWANSTDMNPVDTSLGSLFVDPRFRNLAGFDLRLTENSPLIDRGAPGDPTPPGSGERVDIGYAEQNAASFYVSSDYAETELNDGLSWGIDAFDHIQPALDAAAAAMADLQGALPDGGYSVAVDTGTYFERVSVPSHVRLVGSGAGISILDGSATGSGLASTVTFDGVVGSELAGLTVQNADTVGAVVEIAGASSGILISRNILRSSPSEAIRLTEQSSARVTFNTIVENLGAGLSASGSGTWADVDNNILGSNASGLSTASGGLIRSQYNLFFNSGDAVGEGSFTADPLFAGAGAYIPSAASPAVDAADPTAEVPPAGGLRADLGYKELIASPLTLVLGPEINSTITGNTGVAQVETGIVPVADASQKVTDTTPSVWTPNPVSTTGLPRFYWSQSISQASTGYYRVYSRATDAAGNLEDEAADWYEGSFVIDSTAPSVSWGTPALPGSTTAAAVLAVANVSGSVSTGVGTRNDVARVTFDVTGPSGTVSIPAENGQAWIPLTGPAGTNSYTIKVTAVDEAGNSTQLSKSMTVNAASSVATVTNFAANSGVNSTDLTLRGYARFTSAGATSVAVSVSGGETVAAVLESPGAQFTAWTAPISLPAGEGAKSISVTPSINGTPGSAAALSLILDTTGPTLTVGSPATGTTVLKTVNFSGTASDSGSGLTNVEVSADGGFTWQPAAISSGTWSLSLDFTGQQDAAAYPVKIRAVDGAANISVMDRPVTIDNMPPAGLTPVTFDVPVGQHLEDDSTLSVTWQPPVDVSGVDVYLTADMVAETETPGTLQTLTSSSITLDTPGDWYVHLIAEDGAGNQTLAHYGPWHVRDLNNETFANRSHSIILDGFLDLEHNEWQTNDLLGIDVRSGNPQELYLSADGQFVYLGWSGAWWTLSGVLWAYLDTDPLTGTDSAVDGGLLPGGLTGADRAVEIRGPGDGVLWSWGGSSWTSSSLDFANGSTGDTEVKVPWTPGGALAMIAFALPPEETQPPVTPSVNLAGSSLWALNLLGEGDPVQDTFNPWAMFPTNNGLETDLGENYQWSAGSLADLGNINAGQPTARTVYMSVSSPQPVGEALCSGTTVTYDILLENPEPSPVSGLELTLTANGLTYVSVNGIPQTEGSTWTLTIPEIGAGKSHHILVGAVGASNSTEVTSTITLGGSTPLTPESNASAVLTHRLDNSPPSVGINVLSGGAIPAGSNIFSGIASDLGPDGLVGSGLAGVDISIDDGASWSPAAGTLAWSFPLDIPAGTSSLTLQVRSTDGCDFQTTVEQTFTVDGTPPEVTFTAPEFVTGSLMALSGTAVDAALVKSIEIQLDAIDSAWLAAADPLPPQNGIQAWHWTGVTPQGDGISHTVRVRATDMVGNASISDWQTFVVDTVAPQLSVTQLATELTLLLVPVPIPVLAITAADDAGISTVSVQVIDPLGAVTTQALIVSEVDGSWTYAPDGAGWQPGVYKLRVQAVDVNGNGVLTLPYTLTVTETAIAGLTVINDSPKMVNELVTLTASITAGSNVVFTWDFGDETPAVTGNPVQHAYTAARTYTATVTASNSLLPAVQATTSVTVLALSVEAGLDLTGDEGAAVNVSSSFTGPATGATIDWGDLSVGAGVINETNKLITGSHVYVDQGSYTVTITINDGAGHEAKDTLMVTVSNVAPTADLTNNGPVDEGSPATVTFTDAKDAGILDTLTYSFDWNNDGTYEILDQVDPAVPYTWSDNGTYTVGGKISDGDGGVYEDTTTITVNNVAPQVNAGADGAINEGGTFTGSGSFTDPGTDSWTASVNYGDGSDFQTLPLNQELKTFSLSHTYVENGDYSLTVCVTDDDKGQSCDMLVVTVTNMAPTAKLSNNGPVDEGSPATVSFTEVMDAGILDTLTYSFDWNNDGTYEIQNQTGPSANYIWPDNGFYTVRGKVSDDDAEETVYTTIVTVDNSIPVVDLGMAAAINEGGTFTGSGSFIDPGADSWTVSVDYDDGTTETFFPNTDKTFSLSHIYVESGGYTVIVCVTDNDEGTGCDTVEVTVNNVAPQVDAGLDSTINEGETFSGSGSFTDPGADSWTATVDYGDGFGIQPLNLTGTTFSLSHTYAESGDYTLTVCVTDDDYAEGCGTLAVTVSNVAPQVNAGADSTIKEGETFTGSGSFTDPGADQWTATVDYGDGSGPQALALTGKTFNLSHTYAESNEYPYTVKVCVKDDAAESCGTLEVTVGNVAPLVEVKPPVSYVEYSEQVDEIVFTATDVAADSMTAKLTWIKDQAEWQPINLLPYISIDAVDPCSFSGTTRICKWKVTGTAGMPAGTYYLKLTVTDDEGGTTDLQANLVVDAEQATIAFDSNNPVAVPVVKAGGTSVPFTLSVCVNEPDVPLPGDISLANVSMTLSPIGPGSPVTRVPADGVISADPINPKCVTFSFTNVPVNTYAVQVTVDGGYYEGTNEDVLVVYDPSLGFTTGGGWFYWPETANETTGYPGDRTNFGYTMKYNKKATNIQGSLLLIRHLPDGTIYRVKSNALYGLALGTNLTIPMGWATFSGKSTYLEPGWPEPIGNYEFLVYVEDRNEPGTGVDRFWIKVIGTDLTLGDTAVEDTVELRGGNLVVPHLRTK